MSIEVIRGKGTPTSHLPFSPAIKAGDFVLFLAKHPLMKPGKLSTILLKANFAGRWRTPEKS